MDMFDLGVQGIGVVSLEAATSPLPPSPNLPALAVKRIHTPLGPRPSSLLALLDFMKRGCERQGSGVQFVLSSISCSILTSDGPFSIQRCVFSIGQNLSCNLSVLFFLLFRQNTVAYAFLSPRRFESPFDLFS